MIMKENICHKEQQKVISYQLAGLKRISVFPWEKGLQAGGDQRKPLSQLCKAWQLVVNVEDARIPSEKTLQGGKTTVIVFV